MKIHGISYYRGRLKVNKHALDDELEEHADLLDQIGYARSLANTAMLAAKDKLSKVEARVSDRLREDHEKLTVAQLAALVLRDRDRISAYEGWIVAREEHEQWDSLHDAWKSRGFGMRTLADLYAGQYFALRSTSNSKRETDQRSYEEGRTAMREATPTPRRRVLE